MATTTAFQRSMLNIFKRFDYEEIEGLRDAVRGFSSAKERSVAKELQSLSSDQFESDFEFEGYKFHLEGEVEFLGDITSLSDELCIVALYKKLEITTRKLLLRFYPKLNAHELHKIDYLKTKLPFDITKLNGYPSADELRCINNAIKHVGKVTKPLAAYPGWVAGDPLVNLGAAFTRLAPAVETYIGSLCGEIFKDKGL